MLVKKNFSQKMKENETHLFIKKNEMKIDFTISLDLFSNFLHNNQLILLSLPILLSNRHLTVICYIFIFITILFNS